MVGGLEMIASVINGWPLDESPGFLEAGQVDFKMPFTAFVLAVSHWNKVSGRSRRNHKERREMSGRRIRR